MYIIVEQNSWLWAANGDTVTIAPSGERCAGMVFVLEGEVAEEVWNMLVEGAQVEEREAGSLNVIRELLRHGIVREEKGGNRCHRLDPSKLGGVKLSVRKLKDLIPEKVILLTVTCEIGDMAGNPSYAIACEECPFQPCP